MAASVVPSIWPAPGTVRSMRYLGMAWSPWLVDPLVRVAGTTVRMDPRTVMRHSPHGLRQRRAGAVEVDLAGFQAMVFFLRRAGAGTSALARARQAMGFLTTGGRGVVEQMASHCAAAGELAERLGLSPAVRDGVQQSYARW